MSEKWKFKFLCFCGRYSCFHYSIQVIHETTKGVKNDLRCSCLQLLCHIISQEFMNLYEHTIVWTTFLILLEGEWVILQIFQRRFSPFYKYSRAIFVSQIRPLKGNRVFIKVQFTPRIIMLGVQHTAVHCKQSVMSRLRQTDKLLLE